MIFSGNFPNALSFTIIAGLVFLISAPTVGSRFISQISPCFIEALKIKIREYSQFFVREVVFI